MSFRMTGAALAVCVLAMGVSMPAAAAALNCTQQTSQSRPIDLGVGGGNINNFGKIRGQPVCFSGTLGSMVQDASNNQFILSNNHVLADINKATVGDLIVQPGLADTKGCPEIPTNAVATFSAMVKIKFGGVKKNTIDAAIAAVEPGDVSADILNIGPIASTVVDATIGLPVQKMGDASCFTTGTISAIRAHGKVGYGGGKVAKFVHQIVIEGDFSAPGDSGSLVVTQESCPQAVGLLFAGAPANRHHQALTILNPISDVLTGLNVSMVGGCTAATAAPQVEAQAANAGMSKASVDSASAIRDRHEDQLMSIPGAVGTAIGVSDQAGQPAIHVYLNKMTPEARAAAPKTVEGVPVKLIESGGFVAY